MKASLKTLVFAALLVLFFAACQQPGGNSTGSEYMPDMGHSIAYEANYYNYYYQNTWGSEEEYYKMVQPRTPVKGTIPRTSTGKNGISIPGVGSMPYAYADTEEERTRAINELIDNPYPITDKGLAEAKDLYEVNCGICHGNKGDGAGYLVRDEDPAKGIEAGKYPVQPANFLLDEFVNASNGRYYHSIMHGKNLMGSYADKLSYEERWNVIHYIRSLQAKDKKLAYNQMENTLNAIDKPAGDMVLASAVVMEHHNEEGHDNGHDSDHHGHDHGDHKEGSHDDANHHHGEGEEHHDH